MGFNREVAENAAIYWTKESGNLALTIDESDLFTDKICEGYAAKAKKRIQSSYSWKFISERYEEEFMQTRR